MARREGRRRFSVESEDKVEDILGFFGWNGMEF